MATLRNSKQRDAVLKDLQSRYDHPTAEDVYLSVRKSVPSISLATVYRNLKLLESEGLILKITTGDSDRYDGHTHNHYHFTCNDCMRVLDLEIGDSNPDTLPIGFDGIITGTLLCFSVYAQIVKNKNNFLEETNYEKVLLSRMRLGKR